MNRKCIAKAAIGAALLVGAPVLVFAHDDGSAGEPVCLEANFMMADAMNSTPDNPPFASSQGPGRVLEMNIFTGERGITVNTPFSPGNDGTAVCPDGVVCPGPWKPTGVLSGGQNGHAFITSAAQHALTELHRNGEPIRTVKLPMDDDPGYGTVPRLLGTQFMPNGNIIQAVCDANFFNASNSDKNPDNSNSSNNYFPPVYSTPERAQNSRLLVLDQDTLEVIDEYSAQDDPRWTCMAGIAFSDEGMFVSMFHGDAVFVIDWKAGIDNEKSEGVGSNSPSGFKIGKKQNEAEVIRVIDMLGDENGPGDPWDPNRRDSLRAINFDEGGNLYATNRARSAACEEGDPCNPSVFRQRISIVPLGLNYPTATLALDPGINVIAGIRTNRMSGPGCDAINPPDEITGIRPDPDACDVETLLVAASAMNPGCVNTGPIGANGCFTPGGYVAEYLIDLTHLDGAGASCTGDPVDGFEAGDGNEGCALPIATFFGTANGEDNVDPRMLMVIHQAFGQ
jgi:hypothetical protein